MNINLSLTKVLAKMIAHAMEIRETSYDKAAANIASKKADEERAAEPENHYAGMVDYVQFYTKTLHESALEAAVAAGEPEMANIIFYLMYNSWNDAQIWVTEQGVEMKPVVEAQVG